MTDLTPNDLSHLSDAEFFALCPQGHHAPGPEPLSPAAQAVRDAAFSAYDEETLYRATGEQHAGRIAVAALRAAADQVEHRWDGMECVDHLQAIAAELEGAQ